jgi:predicted xylan-binding protein with Ca-dependent carbohydrate-binding module
LVILDEIAWDTQAKNAVKAGRYASALLGGLGASFRLPEGLRIEAESMININVAACATNGGLVWLNSNGRIESTARFTTTGYYTFEMVAGGMAAQGVMPQVALAIDGVNRTNLFLRTTNQASYTLTLYVTAGTHKVGLAFLNDFYAPPEDRNAAFDRVTVSPQRPPRIVNLNADLSRQVATVQWEASPGKSYEVQLAENLPPPVWQALALASSVGTIASWQDTGAFSGAPPFSPAAPRRFYRIRQVSP